MPLPPPPEAYFGFLIDSMHPQPESSEYPSWVRAARRPCRFVHAFPTFNRVLLSDRGKDCLCGYAGAIDREGRVAGRVTGCRE
jgi:hypothetical protein